MSNYEISKDKLSASHAQKWTLRSPDGEIHEVIGLAAFCKLHNLSRPSLSAVASGRNRHHKGWTAKHYDGNTDGLEYVKAKGDHRGKKYTLRSPDGEIYDSANLSEFCRVHGLNQSLASQLAKGERRHHKGWTVKLYDGTTNGLESGGKSHTLRSPDGEIYDVVNLSEFCRVHSLNVACMCGVAKGRHRHHKGWTSKPYDGTTDGLEYVRAKGDRTTQRQDA